MNDRPTVSAQNMRPVPQSERIHILDILRGFAIFGILAVNLAGFASPAFLPGYAPPDSLPWYDELAQNLVLFFAEGKFYTIFAFLFGLGFAVQLARAAARGKDIRSFYPRRLLVLFGFGVLHSILFWTGDILRLYAVLGFPLLAFRKRANRTLLIWAGALFTLSFVILGLLGAPGGKEEAIPGFDIVGMARAAYTSASYLAVLGFQTLASPVSFTIILVIQGPSVMALFLLGLIVGRLHFFGRLPEQRSVLWRVLWIGLVVGLIGNSLFVFAENGWLASLGFTVGAPALAAFYVSGLSLLALGVRGARLLAPLGQVGRMALSNYVLQSVVCTILFGGFGFGLYEEVGAAGLLGLTFLIYGVQIPLSVWWLRRFQFGPLEWLWRSLTYGRRQPWRAAQLRPQPDEDKEDFMTSTVTTDGQVPGPAPVRSLLAQIKLGLEFPRDPLGILGRWQAEYGDFYRLQVGEMQQVFIAHPDDIREVLVAQAGKFIKDAQYRDPKTGIARYLGNGLLTSDGEFWQRQRRLVAPAFHPKRIESHAATMVEYTDSMLAGWRDGARLDIAAEMTRLTLFIVARALFNTDVSDDARRVAAAMHTIQQDLGTGWFLPAWLPDPRRWRAGRARRDLDQIVYRMIAEWRAAGEDRGDLLSMLLLAEDEGGKRMTDQQARDELVTLLLAGHETTANTLNWTWLLLAQHPEVEAKLHAELDAVLGGRSPRLEDLANLAYTERVVKESMRLYPAAWSVSREAIEDVPLRSGTLPRGSVAAVMIYFTHRDPRWWPAPERFDPERFREENATDIPRYAYLPFGGGPRVCIGNGFAMMEARLLLATIASRYRLEQIPGHVVKPAPLITLNPQGGLPMIVRRRSAT